MSTNVTKASRERLIPSEADPFAADSGRRKPYVAPTVVPLPMNRTDSAKFTYSPVEGGSYSGS